jgi:hypothetical protein
MASWLALEKNSEVDRKLAQQNRLREKIEKREAEGSAPVTSLEQLEKSRLLRTQEAVRSALASVDKQREIHVDEKSNHKMLLRSIMAETNKNQGSKAIASQYYTKELPAHDSRAAANVHHTGSHYVMAGTKQYLKGVRVKGVVSRHSKQAAKRNGQNTTNGVHNKKDGSMSILT